MDRDTLYIQGMENLVEDRMDEAIEAFRKGLELAPGDAELYEGLTQAYVRKNDLDEAIVCARRWSELAPSDVMPHTNLSIIYQKKGMIKEAEHEGSIARTLGWKQELRDAKQDGK